MGITSSNMQVNSSTTQNKKQDQSATATSFNNSQPNSPNLLTPEMSKNYSNGFSVNLGPKLEPIARILLIGVYDDNNLLSKFRGMRYIVKNIWELTLQFNAIYYQKFIKTNGMFLKISSKKIIFPQPKDININMMPFIMSKTFNTSKLPSYLNTYWPIITRCIESDLTQINKIGFLTISESLVDAGKTQRRPGLHTDNPGKITIGSGKDSYHHLNTMDFNWWGDGIHRLYQQDGIYIASSVSNSCQVWNCCIDKDDKDNSEIIGHLGDIEHLRSSLKQMNIQSLPMQANQLCWITDRTPHCTLILSVNSKVYRQFFRLVTHRVSVWYELHSTKNPNGVVPDPNITTIIKQNKFT